MNYRSAIIVLSVFIAGCSPKTYDDCIIKSMKGVTSNVAAIEISRACRSRFPLAIKESKLFSLNGDQLARLRLTGSAYTSSAFSAGFYGKLYNGNSSIDLSEVVFMVGSSTADGKTYRKSYQISALAEKTVIIEVGDIQEGTNIEIVSAKGEPR